MMLRVIILLASAMVTVQATTTNYATELFKYTRQTDRQFECGSDDMLFQGNFTVWDYIMVIGMLVISLGIGVFYGFFQKSDSADDFLLGHGMTLFPVTLSLTTGFITAIELLGNPAEMFSHGTQFSLIVFSILLVVPVAIKVFYPIYFNLNVTSCYEYLGNRFGIQVRVLGAILYIIQMSFYTSVAVLAPAIALSSATGLSTRLAIVLIFVVCVFYSSQGGMKAVVIADTFQTCVLAFSLVLIFGLGTYFTGGIAKVFQTASEKGRLEFFNIDPNPTTRHTIWSVVIGGFFYWTSLLCTNQASIQKALSLRDRQKANWAIFFAALGLVSVFLINFYTGLMTFTHYVDCDPYKAGKINAMDQLLPFYVMDVFGHINTITGVFVAGIFAASLGTVAAALNSLSAVTCEDLLISGLKLKITPQRAGLYVKLMSVGYGLLSFGLIFIVEQMGGILQATLTLNGLIGGVTLGLFVTGIFFKCANTKGTLIGGVLALALVLYVGVMSQIRGQEPRRLPTTVEGCDCFTVDGTSGGVVANEYQTRIGDDDDDWIYFSLYNISYMWFTFFGMLVAIIFSVTISIAINLFTNRTFRNSEVKLTESMAEIQEDTTTVDKEQPILYPVLTTINEDSAASKRASNGYTNGGFENKLEDEHKTNGTLSSSNDKSTVFTVSNGMENELPTHNYEKFDKNDMHGVDNVAMKRDD